MGQVTLEKESENEKCLFRLTISSRLREKGVVAEHTLYTNMFPSNLEPSSSFRGTAIRIKVSPFLLRHIASILTRIQMNEIEIDLLMLVQSYERYDQPA